ncbi:DUF2291 domain-containing protein [Kineosporia sp. J2-2]|uniref:DUF2291 domain-containing protein n=1 Tax=Kineosporia corallincola TaxID=2835133 RepID=A0ABS5TGL4_9ACTN|nr:DUF2291 domain-containing protein [Kineosporia corallincola]MBT0769331.1 DUF2291 domain-containing protein [Kineosporia corallincola]
MSRPARRLLTAATVVAVLVLTGACSHVPGIYTIESGSDAQAAAGRGTFDPAVYVDQVWDSKVLPAVQDQAVDANTLLAAIDADPDAAGEQYGHRAGVGGAFSYLIKGSGTVTAVDADSPSRPLTVRLEGTTDDVSIGTGQVIAGTALRDAVGFIGFSDFANQLDYADVATRLNDRVRTDVLARLPDDPADLEGAEVSFSGAFSSLVPGTVMIVPVSLEVGA